MIVKSVFTLITSILAIGILVVSLVRTSAVKYSFANNIPESSSSPSPEISYDLPPADDINPDSAFWPVAALRDRIWVNLVGANSKKAQVFLYLADKRLSQAAFLLENNEPDLAVATAIKAEMYLQNAFDLIDQENSQDENSLTLARNLVFASLKHREVVEEMIKHSPEEARPLLNEKLKHAKLVYERGSSILQKHGETSPKNPFN